MAIIFKKRYFNHLFAPLMEYSTESIAAAMALLEQYGFREEIYENSKRFVLITHLYNVYFTKIALLKRYHGKYQRHIDRLIAEMILAAASGTRVYPVEYCGHLYRTISRDLNEMSVSSLFFDEVADHYISFCFSAEKLAAARDEYGYRVTMFTSLHFQEYLEDHEAILESPQEG